MDKIIPVVVIKNIKDTLPTLKALKTGGINCAEITFRTEYAKDAIKLAIKEFPDMNIGAGTVINLEQAKLAVEVGAKFLVSPGLSKDIAKFAKQSNIIYYPGCVTPTEIMQALESELNVVKFFPANVYGGLSALKALSGPFPQIKFIPTGGIGFDNLTDFITFDKVFAVGGSFMMKGDIVANCRKINEILSIKK